MKDYPFSTWEDYYAALTECLCTTSYNMIYPKYYEKTSEYGFITDIEIMTDLFTTFAYLKNYIKILSNLINYT